MFYLEIYLLLVFSIFILLNYLILLSTLNSFETVNQMGIGYNLANTFDSYNPDMIINNPNDQITLNGNQFPTKQLIKNLKKYGFKTIRFPVTWINFIDKQGNINKAWMSSVKNVVHMIIKKNIYCILNIHGDGHQNNWLSEGLTSINKYINLWSQIAFEFKDYNEYLIFESMDGTSFLSSGYHNYDIYNNFSQFFVDTIRNSSNFNKERLLIIAGINSLLDPSLDERFKMPNDPCNKLALSIHYFYPYQFVENTLDFWGNEKDFSSLIENFGSLKKYFIDKGYPVILNEIGVNTELNKTLDSVRLYLHTVFSLAVDYGILPLLWDTSNKKFGKMNFYNRDTDQWYDDKIRDIFLLISEGNHIKPVDYNIITNKLNYQNENKEYFMDIIILDKQLLRISINAIIKGQLSDNIYNILIYCICSDNDFFIIEFGTSNMKRQYDGTCIINIDFIERTCDHWLSLESYSDTVIFNNITVEYKESFEFFDYNSFKSFFINNINNQ